MGNVYIKNNKIVKKAYVYTNNAFHEFKQIYIYTNNKWLPIWTYKWAGSEWSECSKKCWFEGKSAPYQTRTINCYRLYNGVEDKSVTYNTICDSLGITEGKNAPTYQNCNTQSCNGSFDFYFAKIDDYISLQYYRCIPLSEEKKAYYREKINQLQSVIKNGGVCNQSNPEECCTKSTYATHTGKWQWVYDPQTGEYVRKEIVYYNTAWTINWTRKNDDDDNYSNYYQRLIRSGNSYYSYSSGYSCVNAKISQYNSLISNGECNWITLGAWGGCPAGVSKTFTNIVPKSEDDLSTTVRIFVQNQNDTHAEISDVRLNGTTVLHCGRFSNSWGSWTWDIGVKLKY